MMVPRSQIVLCRIARAIGGAVLAAPLIALSSSAGTAKLDKETCAQFKTDQIKFIQSGILADLKRGAEWGKSNLSADRLREIELFITLDEQIKFACREATLTPNLLQVEAIAKRLESNPNIDPFAPVPETPPVQKSGAAAGATATQPNLMKPKSKALQQIEGTVAAPSKPAAQPKPKPKPQAAKKPVDDAYTGPPISLDSFQTGSP